LDFWCTKSDYEVQKEVFNNFFNNVELNPEGGYVHKKFNSENDNTNDITILEEEEK
jgi:hypothetical protein